MHHLADPDLPVGYRWASEVEAELYTITGLPGAVIVRRTHDSQGRPYLIHEADLAVPQARSGR